MRIEKLFDISVSHDYYRDTKSSDFDFIPTEDTLKLIRNHRMILKKTGSGILLVAKVDATDKIIPAFDPSLSLQFWIKLNRPEIYNYTALPGKGPFLFSLDSPSDTTLAMTQWSEQVQDTFTIKETQAKMIFPLSRRPINGLEKSGFAVQGLGTRKVLTYDSGKATIELNTQDKQGETFSVIYPAPSRENPGIFGRVEVNIKTLANQAVVPNVQYDINLQAASSVWKYYFVFPKQVPEDTYSIIDEIPANGTNAITFDSGVNLSVQPEPSDTIAQQLFQKYPGSDIYKFTTATAIPFRQAGRKFLRLKRKNEVLVEHLPTPQHSLQTENIIAFI